MIMVSPSADANAAFSGQKRWLSGGMLVWATDGVSGGPSCALAGAAAKDPCLLKGVSQ